MKIVFAGPTLAGIWRGAYPSITFRPPARCGDVISAVKDGATVIGLIDGVFEHMPSVWHKEFLYAMAQGVVTLGAASMGALRAAECQAFGMIGIGEVFEAYASGAIEDDEDVAQVHGPAELGYLPLSEPLVNIRATLRNLEAEGAINRLEHDLLDDMARAIFFKQRTYREIVARLDMLQARKAELVAMLKARNVNVKQQDARRLLDLVEGDSMPQHFKPEWRLSETRSLQSLLEHNHAHECNHAGKLAVTPV
jgi:hypothetical protein